MFGKSRSKIIQQRFHNFFRGEGKGPDLKFNQQKRGLSWVIVFLCCYYVRAVVFLEFHRSIRTKCTVERN